MIILDYYQEVGTGAWWFGTVLSALVILIGFPWMFTVGARSNNKYLFLAPMSDKKAFHVAVLVWRIIVFAFLIAGLMYSFGYDSPPPSSTPKLMPAPSKDPLVLPPITEQLPPLYIKLQNVIIDTSPVWSATYFTTWNLVLITFYFLIGLVVSMNRLLNDSSIPLIAQTKEGGPFRRVAGPSIKDSRWMKLLFQTHQHAGEMAVPVAIFVTFFVWSYLTPQMAWDLGPVLSSPDGYTGFEPTFSALIVHGMNSVFMLFDFAVADYRFNPTHVFLPLVWGCIYMLFHFIMNSQYGMLCYSVMRTDLPVFVFYLGATFVIIILNFYVLWLISKSRPASKYQKGILQNTIAFFKQASDDAEVDQELINSKTDSNMAVPAAAVLANRDSEKATAMQAENQPAALV